jgi:hypothetical protein
MYRRSLFVLAFVLLLDHTPLWAEPGAVRGKVVGPDGQPMSAVPIMLRNAITGFKAETATAADGSFQFANVPFNPYELHVETVGYAPIHRQLDVRSTAPVKVTLNLTAALAESVTVEAEPGGGQLEVDSSTSHVDIDKSYIARAPATVASRAMEELITSTPGFAKDENGRFHFQGAHSQSQFVIDGQTISDQTGVTFSNSIDPGIAQSMEVIYGNVPAEFGEKIGAVVNLTTKSGLASPFKADVYAGASRFATHEGGASVSAGSKQFGLFASVDASESDRFLDPVNFDNLHNLGNTERGFLRLDFASPDLSDAVHFTVLGGRTRRDVPNTYTQQAAGQDEYVRSQDTNVSLGWTHVISSQATFDATAFARLSKFHLYPSVNDTPVLAESDRSLDNFGFTPSLTWAHGVHDIKVGGTFKSFPIKEHFTFGLTDPSLNDPSADGFNPDLAPYDLTHGGRPFDFRGERTGTYYAAYVRDNIRYKGVTLNLGVRYDHNNLPQTEDQLEPRLGAAYYIAATKTVLRGSFNRVLYTPEYENILFSSSAAAAALVPPAVKDSRDLGSGVLLVPSERQNAYTLGAQQGLGKKLRLDFDLWWRHSRNAGDQDQFENTGIVFPVAFASGSFHGWNARLDLADTHGVRGFLSFGHTRAIYVPPPVGGLFLDQGAVDSITSGPFLIDHDQKLQAQGGLIVDVGKTGAWLGANVRYDSGLVTGPSPGDLAGDPDNSFAAPFIVVHTGGDLDPNRIKARTIADFSLGFDLTKRGLPVSLQADLLNAFNTAGVYNIESVFGGTHVIPPRTLAVRLHYLFGGDK